MNDTKAFYKSKAIIGLLALLLGIGMKAFGIEPFDDSTMNQLSVALLDAVGAILVLWGRIRADKKIGLKSK